MREILGKAKTVRELLKGVKYSIDYYQREYKWATKQVQELLDDLSGKFLEEYQEDHERKAVASYPHYFLGSIIISKKDGVSFVVDGQQRLTSLTLLIILLRNLQEGLETKVNVDELIVSEHYGEISFNIDVDDRLSCMKALYDNDAEEFDPADRSESVQTLYDRYLDLEKYFPEELTGPALPFFIDWLLENVHLVEITAYSDDDAYTIFETMNDRGLSLSPTDMLKGYLLANISESKRVHANDRWRARILELTEMGKEVESDCFKAWLRSQYSQKIRERKKNARPEDFDRIGTEFHRWVRDASSSIGLEKSEDYFRFIERDFDFYSRAYLRCIRASEELTPGLEPIFYNAQCGFTLQYLLLLAPLRPEDPEEVVQKKLWLTARFLDILLAWRLWNFRSIAYNTLQYAMFLVVKSIRGLDPESLAVKLHKRLEEEHENFTENSHYHRQGVGYYVHQQNRKQVHQILARITDYVETQSGMDSNFVNYIRKQGKNRFEVEHIWANKFERHEDEFEHISEFTEQRNRIGDLLLLPKSFNTSYGALAYAKKREHYVSQNLLARSLHSKAYEHNPGFAKFIERTQVPFTPHDEFKRVDLDARCNLYQTLAERIWDPQDLLDSVGMTTTQEIAQETK